VDRDRHVEANNYGHVEFKVIFTYKSPFINVKCIHTVLHKHVHVFAVSFICASANRCEQYMGLKLCLCDMQWINSSC